MPRLRAVRTKEEAQSVPEGQGVSVVIPPGDETKLPEVEIDLAAPEEPKEQQAAEAQPSAEPVASEPDESDALRKRLEEQIRAEMAAKHASEMQALAEQIRQFQDTAARSTAERDRIGEEIITERYQAALSGRDAAEARVEAAKRILKQATSDQDVDAMIEAQAQLAEASNDLADYKRYVHQLDEAKKAPPRPAQQQQQQPQFTQRDLAFMAARPGIDKDPKLYAVANALAGTSAAWPSEEFYQTMERLFPLPAAQRQEPAAQPEEPMAEYKNVAAPVSREAPSLKDGKPIAQKVNLSAQEREMAKVSGVDEVTYAKNKLRLMEMKKQGLIQ